MVNKQAMYTPVVTGGLQMKKAEDIRVSGYYRPGPFCVGFTLQRAQRFNKNLAQIFRSFIATFSFKSTI